GKSNSATFEFNGQVLEHQTLNAEFSVYPSIVEDILSSVEGMIRQPYGCFEQVSSVNYPNLMVLQLLDKTGQLNNYHKKTFLMEVLETGYNKLSGYETKMGGFEWYGRTPPHEGLTAYGLLQFHEMEKQGIAVNQQMLIRTKEWLMSSMKSDGSISTNQGKHGFSGAGQLTTTAYVTWVLSQIDSVDLSKQIN